MGEIDQKKRALLKAIAATGVGASFASNFGGSALAQEEDPDELVTHTQFGPDDGTPLLYWALPGDTPNPDEHPGSDEEAQSNRNVYAQWVEQNPEYRIDVEYQPDLESMQTELLRATARDDPPDLADVDSFWMPDHWDELTPVTDVVDDPDDFFPFVRDIVQPEDEWLSVWRNTDCRALYYRKDLIEEYADGEPPRTWDEMIEVGTEIADAEDMDGYLYNGGRWEATTFDNLAHFWAQGGELVDDEGAPILGEGDNYEYLLNVFEWFGRTVESGLTPERAATIDDYALLSEEALQGNLVMFLGGSWQMHTEIIDSLGWEDAEEQWDIAPIPQPEEDMEATGTGGWTIGTFTEDEEILDAAKDFVGLWADPEIMGEWCELQGQLPTRESVYDEHEFFQEDPFMQTYQDMLEHGVARPGFPIYRTISAEWQIAAGRVITGDESPEDALEIMLDNVQAEYEG